MKLAINSIVSIVIVVLLSPLIYAEEKWQSLSGRDGRLVAIPKGWTSLSGRDGRLVAIPPGAKSLSGRDGRLVAILGAEGLKGIDADVIDHCFNPE